MIVVFKVSALGMPDTRMHLPCSAWGETVRARLVAMGYAVQPTDQDCWPDTRDKAELERRDALLEWADPIDEWTL
jgi:hypothetical protein